MANIAPLTISYPDFILGQTMNPDEFDQNNMETVNKVNETIVAVNANTNTLPAIVEKADNAVATANGADIKADNAVTTANGAESKADNAVATANTANTNATSAINTANGAVDTANGAVNVANNAVEFASDAQSAAEFAALAAQSAVGNTEIIYEVYSVVNANNGDGTFNYKDSDDVLYSGIIGENGEQIFALIKGDYPLSQNRIEVSINDTLQRSVASGGLIEVDETHVGLTSPEADGAEITIKYYQKVGLGSNHALTHSVGLYDEIVGLTYVDANQPKSSSAIWFKVV